jgi:hypothetical protein
MFTCRAALHRRENGLEYLKMVVSLGFWYFQAAARK